MWYIQSSRMSLVTQQRFRENAKYFIRTINLSALLSDKLCTRTGVIRGNGRANERQFHLSRCIRITEKDEYYAKLALKETKSKELVSQEFFERQSEKNRETFKNAIELFNKRDIRKRGSVEFIYAALKQMKQYDCHR